MILILGNKANKTPIKSLIDMNHHSSTPKSAHENYSYNYTTNTAKGMDILISTRIDYNVSIFYVSINYVKNVMNINKSILLFKYNKGFYYFESNDKFYYFK